MEKSRYIVIWIANLIGCLLFVFYCIIAVILLFNRSIITALYCLLAATIAFPASAEAIWRRIKKHKPWHRCFFKPPFRTAIAAAMIMGILFFMIADGVIFGAFSSGDQDQPDNVVLASPSHTVVTASPSPTPTPSAKPTPTPTRTSTPTQTPTAQPTETPQKTPDQTDDEDVEMVWVPTNGGKKYHKSRYCSDMEDPIQIPLEDAEKNYEPCKRCY